MNQSLIYDELHLKFHSLFFLIYANSHL